MDHVERSMRGTVKHEKTALVSAPRELAMPWESYSLTELDLVLGTVLKAFLQLI